MVSSVIYSRVCTDIDDDSAVKRVLKSQCCISQDLREYVSLPV